MTRKLISLVAGLTGPSRNQKRAPAESNRLTAAEARDTAERVLGSRTPLEEVIAAMVDDALGAVRKAAEQGKRRVVLQGIERVSWTYGGYCRTEEWTGAAAVLRSLGYKVDFFHEGEEFQFVNTYTTVEW